MRVASPQSRPTPRRLGVGATRRGRGKAKRRSIDTLRRRLAGDGLPPDKSVREEIGRNPGQDLRRIPWKGKTRGVTREAAVLKTSVASKDFCRGRNPGTAACQAGPSQFATEKVARGNGKWVHPGGDVPDTRPEQDSEGKTP
jgi:hypothetical protein